MANLKEIRNRITSVSSTKQITSAMKMVSAAKLKRAQDSVVQMRPYALKLQEILSNLSASLDTSEGIYSQQREEHNILLVAITSNRGLCGAFNNNVLKAVKQLSAEYSSAKVNVLAIGKKAQDFVNKEYASVNYPEVPNNLQKVFDDLTFANVAEIADLLMNMFATKKYDKIILVYNQFKNAATQILMKEQFLPVLPPENTSANSTDYIFEPSKQKIVNNLIPNSLKTQLFKAILDSFAAEHGARMTAMHKATDNADGLIKELKLTYNKARQAAITNEILEIVGGAEALNS